MTKDSTLVYLQDQVELALGEMQDIHQAMLDLSSEIDDMLANIKAARLDVKDAVARRRSLSLKYKHTRDINNRRIKRASKEISKLYEELLNTSNQAGDADTVIRSNSSGKTPAETERQIKAWTKDRAVYAERIIAARSLYAASEKAELKAKERLKAERQRHRDATARYADLWSKYSQAEPRYVQANRALKRYETELARPN